MRKLNAILNAALIATLAVTAVGVVILHQIEDRREQAKHAVVLMSESTETTLTSIGFEKSNHESCATENCKFFTKNESGTAVYVMFGKAGKVQEMLYVMLDSESYDSATQLKLFETTLKALFASGPYPHMVGDVMNAIPTGDVTELVTGGWVFTMKKVTASQNYVAYRIQPY